MKSDELGVDLGVTTNTATSTTRRHFPTLSGWDAADWIPERPAWQAHAACRGVDPAVFHPEAIGHQRKRTYAVMEALYAEGLTYCAACPVRDECREYGLSTFQKDGLWGGLRPGQRNTIWKKRRNRMRRAS